MAHRLEIPSATLPVLAAALLVPATAVYGMAAVKAHGWPVVSGLESDLARYSDALVVVAVAGLVAGLAMSRRAMRLPIVGTIAGPIAVLSGLVAVGVAFGPSELGAWALLGVSTLTGMVALVGRRLRIERDLIAADDPAAGSELFTLRGAIRQVRATLAAIRGALTVANVRSFARRRTTIAAVAVTGVLATAGYAAHAARAHDASPEIHSLLQIPDDVGPDTVGLASGYHVQRSFDGRLRIDVVLADGGPVDVPSLAELDTLPPGWRASVTVELSATTPGSVIVTPFLGDASVTPLPLDPGMPITFATEVCDLRNQPLGLHVEARRATDGPQHVTLFVAPELRTARCD